MHSLGESSSPTTTSPSCLSCLTMPDPHCFRPFSLAVKTSSPARPRIVPSLSLPYRNDQRKVQGTHHETRREADGCDTIASRYNASATMLVGAGWLRGVYLLLTLVLSPTTAVSKLLVGAARDNKSTSTSVMLACALPKARE